MSTLSKDLIRQIIYDGSRLEFSYQKGNIQNKTTDNRRNGYSKKTVKS